MSRFDVLRSLVRSAAQAGRERLSKLDSVTGVREAIEEIRARRITLSEAALTRAISDGMRDVSAVTVSLRDGRASVDLGFEDGQAVVFAFVPEQARFAPRGAKEVIFRVEPAEAVQNVRVREAVGAVAAGIARALWGPILGERRREEAAFVEREGGQLRADLRSVPAVRAMLEGSSFAMALEVLSIEGFAIEERGLRVIVALPMPG